MLIITSVSTIVLIVFIVLVRRYHLSILNAFMIVLWMLLVSHRSLIPRSEGFDNSNNFSGLILIEVITTVFIFAFSVLLFIVITTMIRNRKFSLSDKLLICFSIYATLSSLWAPEFKYAFFWSMRLLSTSFLLLVLSRRLCNYELILKACIFASLFYLPWFWINFLEGNIARDYRIIAGWIHHGILSITMYSIAAYSLFKLLLDKNRMYYLIFIISVITGFLAGGKTGAISFAIVVFLLFLLFLVRGKRLIVKFLFFLILALIGFVYAKQNLDIGLLKHLSYYEQLGKPTIKGRFDLWNNAIKAWVESPLTIFFGYGLTSAKIIGIKFSHREPTTHAHNSFVNLLFELGLFGFTLWFLFVIVSLRSIVKLMKINPRIGLPIVSLFCVLLLSSFTDNVFGGLLYAPFYLLLTAAVISNRIYLTTKQKKLLKYEYI